MDEYLKIRVKVLLHKIDQYVKSISHDWRLKENVSIAIGHPYLCGSASERMPIGF